MYLDAVEKWTGDRPVSCPWRAFTDPLVIDILGASAFPEGQLEQYWGADPPRILIEGIRHYHTVLGRIREKQWEQDKADRERKAKAK